MLPKQYTTLLGNPIVNSQTGEELGEVYDVIIDVETGKLEAFWVKRGVLSGADKILSLHDVSEWKLKVYVKDEDAIINPEEIIKVREIVQQNIHLYLHPVETLSGIKLGEVDDIFFDSMTGQILQIQVAKNFCGFKYNKKLIAYTEIYEVNSKAVVLKDDYKYTSMKLKEVLDLSEAI